MTPVNKDDIEIVNPFTTENQDTWFFHPFHVKGNNFNDPSDFPVEDYELLSTSMLKLILILFGFY